MTKNKSFKKQIFKFNASEFESFALQVFQWQATQNPIYRKYLNLLGTNPVKIKSILEIPFIPISFYKQHRVISFTAEQIGGYYESSGTSQTIQSRHYYYDSSFYLRNTIEIFNRFYGDLTNFHILALLPGYLERKNSSLIAMVDQFIQKSASHLSGFYLDDYDRLLETLDYAIKDAERKTLLLGVSFALLDLAEKKPPSFPDLVVMETGGMKGRREEMIREELHARLKDAFKVKEIHSEYGMTELFSQAYSQGSGLFDTPPWMKILLREHNDPFNLNFKTKSGAINVIDLANIDSCAFIATDDLAKLYDDGSFEVLGRLDHSDLRGCNLLMV